jgi:hypothetical protein
MKSFSMDPSGLAEKRIGTGFRDSKLCALHIYIYKSGNIYFTGGTLLIVSNAQLPAPAADIYF